MTSIELKKDFDVKQNQEGTKKNQQNHAMKFNVSCFATKIEF